MTVVFFGFFLLACTVIYCFYAVRMFLSCGVDLF